MTVGGPTLTLSNGVTMPFFGLGTWQSKPEEVKAAVKAAVHAGYRLIDTAAVYQNEDAIGEAVEELIKEGVVTRDDLFITTKLWMTHLHPDHVEEACRDSLKKLKLDKVDLYLSHMPTAFNTDGSKQDHSVTVEDNWKVLEKVYKAGLARAIGVSNYSVEQVERIMKVAEVPIHNQQVELHLYFPQLEMEKVCRKHNITLTSFSTLGSPGRFNFTLPNGVRPAWAPAPADMDDAFVHELAKKYHKSSAQILLRYVIDRNIAVIPKSVTDSRIKENFDVFDFKLTAQELERLNNSPHHVRLFPQDFMIGHPEDAFASER
ncbi:unnamed protein product, partial [Mesorhabditis belari]|uniref:NADP-dependent oxidoreductase domain-containing protein n=1 Tax=Mesorhabditis belari TaxID=2138241 RepID=A0AAF3FID4_9BILA